MLLDPGQQLDAPGEIAVAVQALDPLLLAVAGGGEAGIERHRAADLGAEIAGLHRLLDRDVAGFHGGVEAGRAAARQIAAGFHRSAIEATGKTRQGQLAGLQARLDLRFVDARAAGDQRFGNQAEIAIEAVERRQVHALARPVAAAGVATAAGCRAAAAAATAKRREIERSRLEVGVDPRP